MFSIAIPASTTLRKKAPYVLANAIYFFAGLGIATAVIACAKAIGQLGILFG